MRKSIANKYCLIIPGRGYAYRAHHARAYKDKIYRIAKRRISRPFEGDVEIRLEYLYRNRRESIDGDNLSKTICDALKGVGYNDDAQIVHRDVRTINMNSSFKITGVPLDQHIADLFANRESFTIIRLRRLI